MSSVESLQGLQFTLVLTLSSGSLQWVRYRSLDKLINYIESEDFRGHDPYDALNSRFLRTLSFDSKYCRILFTQALKRFPLNLRPALGIKKEFNPKALGLFLWGYAKLYAAERRDTYLDIIAHLLDQLRRTRSPGYSGECWGYNFDWQSRAFFIPKHTPTIVNSSFVGHALLDTYQITGNQEAIDLALPIRDFILKDLHRTVDGDTFCFSYTPLDRTAVHNANLLGASLLARIYLLTGDVTLEEAAMASLAYSMKYQHEDGSWYYAESDFQRWIDSFHTGFNLQSINYFITNGLAHEYRSAFDRGIAFYSTNFFLNDGTPKYYHNRVYPIDIHAPAQAVALLSRLGRKYRDLSCRILIWMVVHMQDPKGYFHFQKTRYYTNRIPYMRWSQAWAFHALTEYRLHQESC